MGWLPLSFWWGSVCLSGGGERERERERESQVHLVSHFEEHSPGVTMTREFILFWNFMPQHFLLFFY